MAIEYVQCERCRGHVPATETSFDGLCRTCLEWEARLVPMIERNEEKKRLEEAA